MPFEELIEIMRKLRDPEGGCPWDLEQTRESLKPYLLEECHEVLDAIEEGLPGDIREELGDLLFQIVFQAQVAEEAGEFTIEDVIAGIRDKMVGRHPHVFGNETYATSAEVVNQWEKHKKKEGKLRESVLGGIPSTLPALLRAYRLQERASRVGFDWSTTDAALGKLETEMREFQDAVSAGSWKEIDEEFGDVLFMLVNLSRFIGVDPEDSLKRSTRKFIRRFQYIEKEAAAAGKKLQDMTLSEMDALWDEAKEREDV